MDDVLGESRKAVILYLTTKDSGHYVTLFENANGLVYFNSYGLYPDEDFKLISNRDKLGESVPYLSNLLKGKKVDINKVQYQDEKNKTCGHWVIFRNYMDEYSNDQFQQIVQRLVKQRGLTPDEIVVKV